MQRTDVVAATTEVFRLAEGPVWDAARSRLLWVDIHAGAVLQGALRGGRVEVAGRETFDGMVGGVVAAADGRLLVAAQERLVEVGPDGLRTDGPRVAPAGDARRLNNLAVDPAGRAVVGTLSLDGPSEREELVRLEHDGSLTMIDDDLTLSNGLAWSTDGQRFYSADTERRTIFVRSYDAGAGATGERQVHVRVDDGLPDGIATDVEDHLWVAVWGAGEVRRYDPDGALVERLAVPAPHTSSVGFAGDDLELLVITTASAELSDAGRAAHPDAGRLFTAHVGVAGRPVTAWSGSVRAVS